MQGSPFRGGGIEYLNDLDSYAGGGVMPLVGLPKSDRLKGRGQTKQHRPLAGTQMLGLHRCAFLHGGLVYIGVRPYNGPALCAFLHNGRAVVNPQSPF